MQEIVTYRGNDGKVYEHQHEALVADARWKLCIFARKHSVRIDGTDESVEYLQNVILENYKELQVLLQELAYAEGAKEHFEKLFGGAFSQEREGS